MFINLCITRWLWLTGKVLSSICLWWGYMASPDSIFFLPAFSLVFPTYLYSLHGPKTVSLLTEDIYSIQRGNPTSRLWQRNEFESKPNKSKLSLRKTERCSEREQSTWRDQCGLLGQRTAISFLCNGCLWGLGDSQTTSLKIAKNSSPHLSNISQRV